MPSSLESFGMVAIEAIKHQLPVIISSTSGCKEIITHNKNGFVFDINGNASKNLALKILDLAIAVGVLSSMGVIESNMFQETIFIGELSLDGKLNKINGILPICVEAIKHKIKN